MSQNYDKLVEVVNNARPEIEKAESGNKAATVRVRKLMQDVKKLAQDLRQEMMGVREQGQ